MQLFYSHTIFYSISHWHNKLRGLIIVLSCRWNGGLMVAMFMMGFMMMVMVGLAMVFVMNISHIATIAMMICMIVDSLNPPIWQMNLVNTLGFFPVRVLLMAKVRTIVFVMNVVLEMVGLGMVILMVVIVMAIMMVIRVRDCHHCHYTDQSCQDNFGYLHIVAWFTSVGKLIP